MTTMSEYAALHGWEVGAQLRYKRGNWRDWMKG